MSSGTSDAELERLTMAGVRGARVLLFPGGLVAADEIPALASRIEPFGWHVQLQLDGRTLPEHEAMLAALPVPLVIDHNGKFIDPVTIDQPAFRTLLRLLANGKCWVKASAPYETSKLGPPDYADVGALARRLIEVAPEHVVWGSNWPHGAVKGTKPDTQGLFRLLEQWAPDAGLAHVFWSTTRKSFMDSRSPMVQPRRDREHRAKHRYHHNSMEETTNEHV